jgi:hypothetical protein
VSWFAVSGDPLCGSLELVITPNPTAVHLSVERVSGSLDWVVLYMPLQVGPLVIEVRRSENGASVTDAPVVVNVSLPVRERRAGSCAILILRFIVCLLWMQ